MESQNHSINPKEEKSGKDQLPMRPSPQQKQPERNTTVLKVKEKKISILYLIFQSLFYMQ